MRGPGTAVGGRSAPGATEPPESLACDTRLDRDSQRAIFPSDTSPLPEHTPIWITASLLGQ
jgi:hypothetical protein